MVVPGLGLFGFGRTKKEARITTEFFVNAINVMAGATALEDEEGEVETPLPQAPAHQPGSHIRSADVQAGPLDGFEHFHNYVALPRSEAFRIEYWALEEAKLQRMPAEAEFSRKIALVVGGGSGIGREVAPAARPQGRPRRHRRCQRPVGCAGRRTRRAAHAVLNSVASIGVDLGSADSLVEGGRFARRFTSAVSTPSSTRPPSIPLQTRPAGLSDAQWAKTFLVNVTGNYLLAQQMEWIFRDQQLPAAIVLTGSANAVVPKKGSEAYDTSKSAVNHLVRELAMGLAPFVRVNGIAPATVVAGSTMFPRDRVVQSLEKYAIAFAESESTEELRAKLANFYAQRTLTRRPILPDDCANAIVWLLSDASAKTTGHIIPVDGGLPEAFLR